MRFIVNEDDTKKRFKNEVRRGGTIFSTEGENEEEGEGEPIDFAQVQGDLLKTSIPCWGCLNRLTHGSDNPQIKRLYQLYQTSRGKMSDDELAKQIHKAKIKRYPGGVSEEHPANIEWPLHMVKTHITLHMVDLESRLYEQLNEIITIKQNMKNCIFYKDKKSDSIATDIDMVKAVISTQIREIQIATALEHAKQ
jgi:hypothetical protein